MVDFIVVKFHNYYDGLIGNDILKRLNALIDYKNNQLNLNEKSVSLIFGNETELKTNITNQAYIKEKKSLKSKVISKESNNPQKS